MHPVSIFGAIWCAACGALCLWNHGKIPSAICFSLSVLNVVVGILCH